MTPLRYAIVFSVALSAAAAFGNTTWYFNSSLNIDTTKTANGNMVLTDANCMGYWTNALGQAGTGLPTAQDDLVFDGREGRIRVSGASFNSFGGHSLQVGTESVGETLVWDGGNITATGYSLKLCNAYLFGNSDANRSIDTPIEILSANPSKPTVIAVGNVAYEGRTYRFAGAISGSSDAHLRFGPWPTAVGNTVPACASNTTFRVDDITGYAGTITVASAHKNDGENFGTHLCLYGGTQTSDAKMHVERGGSLSLNARDDMVTVKELSLACGSRLWFNRATQVTDGRLWCVRATDALTVEKGDDKVEIYWRPIIRGNEHYRMPILVGPAGSTFTEDDFMLADASTASLSSIGRYNRDLHLEADDDPVTGERSLYVVAHGFVFQTSNYSPESSRDGADGTPSSITNAAAWWNGLAPDPTNSAALYRTALSLRTLYAPRERYEFPCAGFWLNGGTLVIQAQTFEVPEFWCDGGTIAVGQGHPTGYTTVSLVAPKIHFPRGTREVVTLRAYSSDTFVVKGEIDGDADVRMLGFGGTGSPKCSYLLDGPNTNFTGAISVATEELRPAYHNFGSLFPTLYVADGRNLGGKMAAFDPRALTLTTLARLTVTNNTFVTLADGLNRGVYIKHTGRFYVGDAGLLDAKWPLLLSGKMWKEGAGTLVLGGAMKHEADDGGELTDVPRAGSNLFEIVKGTVKIAHADALAGVETTVDKDASLQLALDPANADLAEYGIRNTTVDAPFTLDASFGGKLPLTLDNAGVEIPASCRVMTNALVTVKSASAQAVAEMLSAVKPWRARGFKSEIVPRANGDTDTTTLLLVSRYCGSALYLR